MRTPHFTSIPRQSTGSGTASTLLCDPHVSHHEIEQTVWRELRAIPNARFFSLTVHRLTDGVCIQGILEVEDEADAPDICALIRRAAPVENVVNQLLVRGVRPKLSVIPR